MPNLDLLEKLINSKTTLAFSLVLLFVLVFANLVGTNVLATQGFSQGQVETKILSLQKENSQYQVKIEEISNLNKVAIEANTRGFIQSQNIVFMPTPATTALR